MSSDETRLSSTPFRLEGFGSSSFSTVPEGTSVQKFSERNVYSRETSKRQR